MAEILTQAAAALQTALDGALTKLLVVATGNAISLPPSLADTDRPLVLSGTIVPSTTQGANTLSGQSQVSVQTSAGQIVIAVDSSLAQTPRGTVAVALQPGSPPTATILAPTAQQTAQAALTPEATASQAALNVAVQTTAQNAQISPLAIGQVVSAIVLPATGGSAAQAQTLSSVGVAPIVPVAAAGSGTQAKSTDVILQTAVAPAQAGSSGAALIERRLASGQIMPGEPDDAEDADEDRADEDIAADNAEEPAPPPATPPQAATYLLQDPQSSPTTQRFVILNIVNPDSQETPELTQVGNSAGRSAMLPNEMGDPLEATVVAQTLSGQPVLATRVQTMVMTEPATVALGAQITLRPVAHQPAAAAPAEPAFPAPYTPLPLAAGGRVEWPALAQLVSLLPSIQPQALRALSEVLPRINGDFVQRFVAFATAQRSFAPAVSTGALQIDTDRIAPALARTMTGLLSQLQEDLSVAARAGAPSKDGHWQAISVPVMGTERLDAIQMFVRRQIDPDEADEQGQTQRGKSSASTRFLVEVNPSRLGPVQLDGLLRTQRDTTLRLDMVVRPATNLTDQQGREIDSLFQTALNAAGLSGSLKLQPGRAGFVLPQSDSGGHFSRMA